MLIYARRDVEISQSHEDNSQNGCTVTKPSSGALRVVQDLNNAHEAACERYLQKSVTFVIGSLGGTTERHMQRRRNEGHISRFKRESEVYL
jgi:hypothetical protein